MTNSEFPAVEGAGLVLDREAHRYYYNGKRVAGVTEILSGVGIIDASWFTEESRDRGTQVHRAMELLVHGQLDWKTVDERIIGYVQAGEKFLREAGVIIGDQRSLTEHLVYSTFRYGGKVDALLYLFGKSPTVVDWKTGEPTFGRIQTAAYADPLSEELGLPLERAAVKLSADGTYRLHEYDDADDLDDFLAAARIYNRFIFPKRKD